MLALPRSPYWVIRNNKNVSLTRSYFITPLQQIKAISATLVKAALFWLIQRCGIPTASDRILASRQGAATVEALTDGESGVIVALGGPRVERVPLEDVVENEQPLDHHPYKMAEVLAELSE
jgi:6-phosphofructokinase